MGNFCSLDGKCKTSDKIWGIVNPKTNNLHRLTFSKSLADLIVETIGEPQEVRRFKFKLGKRLKEGEKSPNGLYAIMSERKKIALRIALTYESADLYNDRDSRFLQEVWISE